MTDSGRSSRGGSSGSGDRGSRGPGRSQGSRGNSRGQGSSQRRDRTGPRDDRNDRGKPSSDRRGGRSDSSSNGRSANSSNSRRDSRPDRDGRSGGSRGRDDSRGRDNRRDRPAGADRDSRSRRDDKRGQGEGRDHRSGRDDARRPRSTERDDRRTGSPQSDSRSHDRRTSSERSGSRDGRASGGRDDRRDRSGSDRGQRFERGARGGAGRSRPADSRYGDKPDSRRTSDHRNEGDEDRAPRENAIIEEVFDVDVSVLPKEVRRELETLAPHVQERTEKLLAAARILVIDDPEAALRYARATSRTAGRLSVVREAIGICAYHAGDYALARTELNAAMRMSDRFDLLPLIADCERGLGKPDQAVTTARSTNAQTLKGDAAVEMALVEAGARQDLGQQDIAIGLLQRALNTHKHADAVMRLSYALAEAQLSAGDKAAARESFMTAAGRDPDGVSDALDRVAEIDADADTSTDTD